ncbi:hypothetical protein AB6A40_002678 [Gnathostoma spinigerum]|uniref:Transcription factor CBF/NF-Y/archaeal histone domain-containing protein n=1 Tax=Gnathostoma spinigerum TaxID=75299 RepID=A0ABD6ECT8_9BILA
MVLESSSSFDSDFVVSDGEKMPELAAEPEVSVAAQSINQLPLTRVKAIMYSSSEQVTISNEGLFAMAKATELFIAKLAEETCKAAKGTNYIEYSHVADLVQENEEYEFLSEMVPRMVTFSEIMHLLPTAATSPKKEKTNSQHSIYDWLNKSRSPGTP